jgi:hypothetical protein
MGPSIVQRDRSYFFGPDWLRSFASNTRRLIIHYRKDRLASIERL